MIHTCLFDLGNVVLFFSHEQMCAQIGAVCGRSAADIRDILFDAGLERAFERGDVSEQQFHLRLQEAVGREVDVEALKQAGSDIFRLNAAMVPVLKTLKARGTRLVLLSNTSVTHFDYVRRRFDVVEIFDAYVLSCEVGAVKPEPAIFEAALDAIQCAPTECFYTDDIAEYVETARGYGLQAEVFVDVPTLIEQLRLRGIAGDFHNQGA